jgi:hypothetical protein
VSFEPTQVFFRCETHMDDETSLRTYLNPLKCVCRDYLFNNHGWQRTVVDYTQRDLSIFQDKLPALSGLASDYQANFRDTYLASFWLD